jgi:hypothetical protein
MKLTTGTLDTSMSDSLQPVFSKAFEVKDQSSILVTIEVLYAPSRLDIASHCKLSCTMNYLLPIQ